MPGGLLSEVARDLIATEIVDALQLAIANDDLLDDGVLDKTKALKVAVDAIDKLQDTRTMAVKLTDEDGNVRIFQLQDLPTGTIDELGRKHEVGWRVVTNYPLDIPRLGLAVDLVRAAAEQMKIKGYRGKLSQREVEALFESVPDDVRDEQAVSSSPLPSSPGDET